MGFHVISAQPNFWNQLGMLGGAVIGNNLKNKQSEDILNKAQAKSKETNNQIQSLFSPDSANAWRATSGIDTSAGDDGVYDSDEINNISGKLGIDSKSFLDALNAAKNIDTQKVALDNAPDDDSKNTAHSSVEASRQILNKLGISGFGSNDTINSDSYSSMTKALQNLMANQAYNNYRGAQAQNLLGYNPFAKKFTGF